MALYTIIHYNRWFSKAAVISASLAPAMNLFKEDIELKRIEMENKFIKNSLPLREKDLRINEINDSIL